MKSIRFLIIALTLAISLLFVSISIVFAQKSQSVPHLRQGGSCNVPGDHPTIASALADDTCNPILVDEGTYFENLIITRSVTIQGSTITPATFIDGGMSGIVIEIGSDLNVTLSHLQIVNGSNEGITNGPGSTLTLTHSTVSANLGGGIWSDINSTLVVSSSAVVNNSTVGNGGGISSIGNVHLYSTFVVGNEAAMHGGGISFGTTSPGTLTLTNSEIESNQALNGGGLYNGQMGNVVVFNSPIYSNTALWSGGGIYNQISGTIYLTRSLLMQNRAFAWGGGLSNHGTAVVEYSHIISNTADGSGGGLENSPGWLTVQFSRLKGNIASDRGGAIFNMDGTVTMDSSTLYDNTATYGGGYFHAGLFALASADFVNSTLSGNSASNTGGGIFVQNGTTMLTNLTIYANSAMTAGGAFQEEPSLALAVLAATNTIIAGSTDGGDCGGIITSLGHNLAGDDTCTGFTAAGDITDTNPLLGLLQDNGGATETHASLAPHSPVINAGSCVVADDQRGVPRPQGLECDIGAYENQLAYNRYLMLIFQEP